LTSLLFLIISNFITCSYTRNFTVFELLKKPLFFSGTRQENFFIFRLPKAIPYEETVLVIDGFFSSKLKDLAIKKGVQEKDKENHYVVIDINFLESSLSFDGSIRSEAVSLVYSPWYRFVAEPFQIGMGNLIGEHVLGVFAYALATNNIPSNMSKDVESVYQLNLEQEYCGFEKITIVEKDILQEIKLEGANGLSKLNLIDKRIVLSKYHEPNLFAAINEIGEEGLKNISITKSDFAVELAYEGIK
tara:strand:- start:475 stop:1212 length:738 start_codon:yes stop_codon:yes gene_type:complete